jgi:hypothetical protein
MTSYGTAAFYIPLNLSDNPKARTKFIKDLESIIRSSAEYKRFIKFLRTEALMNYCTIMKKMPEDVIKKITLEMHHYPFTLYDIVETVLERHLVNDLDFSRLSIANEVMDLHYNLKVGIVPITKTMHELAHSRNVKISMKDVFGDYTKFMEFYKFFIPSEKKLEIEELENMTEEYLVSFNSRTLELNPTLFIESDDEGINNNLEMGQVEDDFDLENEFDDEHRER